MNPLYNHPILKMRRKNLRKNQTDSESILWKKLRYKKIAGIKFYRQFSIGPYILDFYCPKWRLAIELDGDHHQANEQSRYDEERTVFLNNENVRVIRFGNEEVIKSLASVMERILNSSST